MRLWLELGFQAKVEAKARLPWKELLEHAHLSDPGVFDACREATHLKDKARNLGLLEDHSHVRTVPCVCSSKRGVYFVQLCDR